MKKTCSNAVDFVLVVPCQEISNFAVQIIESYLKKEGFEVVILFFKERRQQESECTENEISLLVDFIKKVSPRLVGFTVMSPFFNISKTLTKRVKMEIDIPIIWGGVHATINPDECINISDICCIGEGEEPLRQILEHLRVGSEINGSIPNCWINKNGAVVKNTETYMCNDLDTLPYPVLTGNGKYIIKDNQIINEDPYLSYIKRTGKYAFKAFRGCPMNCTYCGNKSIREAYGSSGNYIRKRSVDNVIGELKEVVKTISNIKTIASYDEVFINNRMFVQEFSAKYKKDIHIPLTCSSIVTVLTEENVQMMADAGLVGINVGVEAFSEEIREKVYKRKMSNKRIIEKARMLHKYGIYIVYDFIYDCPLETEKDIEDCFWKLIINLPRPAQFNKYSLSNLPKTELTNYLLKEGYIESKDVVGESDKGLVQWKVGRNYGRNNNIWFWIILYDLFGWQVKSNNHSCIIPLFIIKMIACTKNYVFVKIVQKAIVVITSLIERTFWERMKAKIRTEV